jgi:hypothetical protein
MRSVQMSLARRFNAGKDNYLGAPIENIVIPSLTRLRILFAAGPGLKRPG